MWDGNRRSGEDHESDRGATPLVGLLLLFALVFIGATIVVVTGMGLIDALQDGATDEQTVQSMQEIRSDLATLEQAGDRKVPLEILGQEPDVKGEGTMTVELVTTGADNPSFEREMGSLVYDGGADVHAYQAGGIFTVSDSGTTVAGNPDLNHGQESTVEGDQYTIELPPLTIEEGELDGSEPAAVFDDEAAQAEREQLHDELFEEIESGEKIRAISITIEDNPYHEGWARFLESELEGNSAVDHDATQERVTATAPIGLGFLHPVMYDVRQTPPQGALVTEDGLDVSDGTVHGYDSNTWSYDELATEEGVDELEALERLAIQDETDLSTPGTTFDTDNLVHGDDFDDHEPVGDTVDENVDDVEDVKDSVSNDETAAIDGTSFDVDDDTIETGLYYVDDGAVDGALEIDTSDGDVVIAVDDDLTIGDDVTIVGDDETLHEVRWLVGGDVTVDPGVEVTVVDEDGDRTDQSYRHWVFGGDGTEATLDDGVTFTGVVYNPHQTVDVDAPGVETYGALVGDVEDSAEALHAYDWSLVSEGAQARDGSIEADVDHDAEVTLVGAEYAWTPLYTGWIFEHTWWDPGEMEEFEVDLPDGAWDDAGELDDEIDYFEYGTGTTGPVDVPTTTLTGTTEHGLLDLCWFRACETVSTPVEPGDYVVATVESEEPINDMDVEGFDDYEYSAETGEIRGVAMEDELEFDFWTSSVAEYEITVERVQNHDELTFDITRHDEFEIDITSEDAPFYAILMDDGEPVSIDDGSLIFGWGAEDSFEYADAGEELTIGFDNTDVDEDIGDGEITVFVGSESLEPIEYDISTEQTYVHRDGWDLDFTGWFSDDPPWMQQFPVTTELQIRDGPDDPDPRTYQPWPETDLEDVSYPPPAHANDVNHPGVEYPMTYGINVSEGEEFAPRVEWRDDFCDEMDSYAGTWRYPHWGEYEDQPLFEMGCSAYSSDDGMELNQEMDAFDYADGEVDTDEEQRVKILEDGDEVPEMQPFEAQHNLTHMFERAGMADRFDEDSNELDLAPGEFVMLFELAPESYLDPYDPTWEDAMASDGDAPDFNNMVMLYEVTELHLDETSIGFDETDDHSINVRLNDGVITIDSG